MEDAAPRQSQIAPGYRLDRYEMLCPIAEGGMASVWVARLRGKRGFEKLVAIKTILPKFAQDPRFERMFLDEAAVAARIEHANVAQVLDLGEEHDVLYIAMELIDGDSLQKLHHVTQKRGITIPTGVLLRILSDTCGGLHAAHELRGDDGEPLGVVHRDVSPQNILVSMRGTAKLIDFGIAKARDRVSEDTTHGMMKGKIHYMPPEQALGRPVDRRADVWAVGAILYSFLAGRPVYEGENQLATLHLLASGRPPLPLPPTVHPAVNALVMRALAHAPEDRYPTVDEMQDAIETAMVTARLVTSASNVGTFVQEHMADRARKRKEGLELALSAAAQRHKIAKMLELAGADSSAGHVAAEGGEIPVMDETDSEIILPSGVGSSSGRPSTPSSATLGSALASPVPEAEFHVRPRGSLGAVALGAALLTFVVIGVALRTRAPTPAAALPTLAQAAPPPVPSPIPLPPVATDSTAPSVTPVDTGAAPGSPTPETPSASAQVTPPPPRRNVPARSGPVVPTKPSAPRSAATPQRQRADDGF